MTFWTVWLDLLGAFLNVLASEVGLGLGLAIIVATLALRTALLPISWQVAYRGCMRQKKLTKLQPELRQLKNAHAKNPQAYAREITALYRRHSLTLVDTKSLWGALIQMPLLLGMYQALRQVGEGVRFLWVASLARPDTWLAIIAGVTTALLAFVNPDVPEQVRLILLIVPSIVIVVVALKLSSALAIYWATSNCFSALQTATLHVVVNRRLKAGALKI